MYVQIKRFSTVTHDDYFELNSEKNRRHNQHDMIKKQCD